MEIVKTYSRWPLIILLGMVLNPQFNYTDLFAAVYYVSSSGGSDFNNGTSTSTPWQTIAKVNTYSFASGDAVYFRCGDQFQGQINLNRSNVTLGSYGSGNKPVISGAIQITGWTVYSGSIYMAQASSYVKNLYANGIQMTLARYPNTGFMLISSKSSSTVFSSSGITQPTGYWDGANCRLRTNAWTFESPTVSTQGGNTIVLASPPSFNEFSTNWGFYLDNKLAALDVENEWYCDPVTNVVYFYAPGGVDPSILNVYGSVYDYGVNSTMSYITVNGLEFVYQAAAGLNFTGNNITIRSNRIFGGLKSGIDLKGKNNIVDSNTVQNMNGNGIHTYYTSLRSTISNNTIKNIGLVKGYQRPATAYGILSEGTYAIISGNLIDSIGYDGIYGFSHDTIQKNIIKNTMLTLADGGAIYTTSDFVTIQNNFIFNVPGSNEGVSLWTGKYKDWTGANGIYLDNKSNNCNVRDNTVIKAKSVALMINYGTRNHSVSNNSCYDCASNQGGYFIHIGLNPSLDDGGHIITNNIFYPASIEEKMIEIQVFSGMFIFPGIIDSNYYLNTRGNKNSFEILINRNNSWSVEKYSFTGWKSLTGQEIHSTYSAPAVIKLDTVLINDNTSHIKINLKSKLFFDLDNKSIDESFMLPPYSLKILTQKESHTKFQKKHPPR